MGYSPWGCKESDTTERLHFTFTRKATVLASGKRGLENDSLAGLCMAVNGAEPLLSEVTVSVHS